MNFFVDNLIDCVRFEKLVKVVLGREGIGRGLGESFVGGFVYEVK